MRTSLHSRMWIKLEKSTRTSSPSHMWIKLEKSTRNSSPSPMGKKLPFYVFWVLGFIRFSLIKLFDGGALHVLRISRYEILRARFKMSCFSSFWILCTFHKWSSSTAAPYIFLRISPYEILRACFKMSCFYSFGFYTLFTNRAVRQWRPTFSTHFPVRDVACPFKDIMFLLLWILSAFHKSSCSTVAPYLFYSFPRMRYRVTVLGALVFLVLDFFNFSQIKLFDGGALHFLHISLYDMSRPCFRMSCFYSFIHFSQIEPFASGALHFIRISSHEKSHARYRVSCFYSFGFYPPFINRAVRWRRPTFSTHFSVWDVMCPF